jgi:hypothetical protein
MARLKNISGGVRGFFGARSITKAGKVLGLRIAPNETATLTAEQLAAIKEHPHCVILAAHLASGELLDLDDAFSDVAASEPAAVPAVKDKLTDLTGLEETAALAVVIDEDDLTVLERWYRADDRTSVKEQINKRGQYIANNKR